MRRKHAVDLTEHRILLAKARRIRKRHPSLTLQEALGIARRAAETYEHALAQAKEYTLKRKYHDASRVRRRIQQEEEKPERKRRK